MIKQMVRENPTWDQTRVAAELALTLGLLVSPRTVRAYWLEDFDSRRHPGMTSQR